MSMRKPFDFRLLIVTAATILGAALSPIVPGAGLVGLAGILLWPGYLLLLLLRPRKLSRAEWVLFSLGLSLLAIMIVGLASNLILPLFGVKHPLAYVYMAPIFGVLLTIELAAVALRRRWLKLKWRLPSGRDLALGAGFALLPVVSALGADILNNEGSSAIATGGIALVAITAVVLMAFQKRVPTWLWGWAVFCLALATLWSTSLRGWYVTGHDVQLEYYVFRLTDAGQRWSMANLHDAYNACLSITILPTVLKSLTGIEGILLYKIVYQVIFAAFTAGVMVLSRRFASNAVAFLAAFIFITFPTFITDMPMLCRQEIAFGFFILLLMTLFSPNFSTRTRRLLFGLLGVGVVFSHYSTTFVTVGILAGGFVLVQPWRWRAGRLSAKGLAGQSHKALTVGAVAVMIAGTVLWTGIYTKTGNNITGTIAAAAKALPTVLNPKTSGEGSAYSPVKTKAPTPQAMVAAYAKNQHDLMIDRAPKLGGLYPDFASYAVAYVPQPQLPLSPIGRVMAAIGAAPGLLISLSKGGYAVGLQAMIIVGAALAVIFRRRFNLSVDFVALAPVGIGLLGVQVVIPVIDYGLFRMMQQDLIFLSLPVALASLQILAWLRIRSERLRLTILTGLFAVAFVFLSGVVTQVTGGGGAQLALSNSGFYYDAYYTTTSDISAYSWLKQDYKAGYPIYSDRFSRMKIMANTGITTLDGITPGVITQGSYVVLSNANVRHQSVAFYYQGQLLYYSSPTDFLNSHKNLIYSNTINRIYQ